MAIGVDRMTYMTITYITTYSTWRLYE